MPARGPALSEGGVTPCRAPVGHGVRDRIAPQDRSPPPDTFRFGLSSTGPATTLVVIHLSILAGRPNVSAHLPRLWWRCPGGEVGGAILAGR